MGSEPATRGKLHRLTTTRTADGQAAPVAPVVVAVEQAEVRPSWRLNGAGGDPFSLETDLNALFLYGAFFVVSLMLGCVTLLLQVWPFLRR